MSQLKLSSRIANLSALKNGVSQRFNNFQLPEKYKGGKVEKFVLYWKNMYLDYKDVAVETVKETKRRPIRSSLILTALGSCYYAYKTNPTERDYVMYLVKCSNDIALLSDSVRNNTVATHCIAVQSALNNGLLRYMNCGLFTIVWVADYPADSGLYSAQCPYTQPAWSNFWGVRNLDYGFLGSWLVLRGFMLNYDVNEDEWREE